MSEKSYVLSLNEAEADWLGKMLKEYAEDEDDEFNLDAAALLREKLLSVREPRRYEVTAHGPRTVQVEARDRAEAMAKARTKLIDLAGGWTVRQVEEPPEA